MQTVIDNLDSLTGCTGSSGGTIYGLNDITEYIAGELSHSLILKFVGTGAYCQKTLSSPVSIGSNDEFTLHIWSQQNATETGYRAYDSFVYKIDLGSGKEFQLPLYNGFNAVTFDITGISTIERIRITSLDDVDDYLCISYAVMSYDESPVDIMTAMQSQFLVGLTGSTTMYHVGQIKSVMTGDTSITLSSTPLWAGRYTKLMITDGVNTEYHHVYQHEGWTFYMSSLFDGREMIHDYASADVYVSIPVQFGTYERDIILPSISVWGLAPEDMRIESDIQSEDESWKPNGSVYESTTGQWFKYNFLVDCENKTVEILAYMSSVVRKTIAQKKLWINGQMCFMDFSGPSTLIEPTEVMTNLPKMQYNVEVTVKEKIWAKKLLPVTTTQTNTIHVYNS